MRSFKMKRRVVVTGLGIVSPLGTGMDTVWANLTAGQSGIRKIAHFKIDDMPSQIAGYVPLPGYDGYNTHGFNPDTTMEPKDQRKVDPLSSLVWARPMKRSVMPVGPRKQKTKNAAPAF
jgi:3-oxoacyl-(acyl-carrier-protein) synthase